MNSAALASTEDIDMSSRCASTKDTAASSSAAIAEKSAQERRADAFGALRVGFMVQETIVVDGFGRFVGMASREQQALLAHATDGVRVVPLETSADGAVCGTGNRGDQLAARLRSAIPADWRQSEPVKRLFDSDPAYVRVLAERLANEYRSKPGCIFPPKKDVFRALAETPLAAVRVVIVGQDPYVAQGQADGLAFSVRAPHRPPPSLVNVLREMGVQHAEQQSDGDLTCLAHAGVLLLNSSLTVERNKPRSHAAPFIDWHPLTDALLRAVATQHANCGVCVMLWGRDARAKASIFTQASAAHLVLTAAHPSPKSADKGFFGCQHFQQCDRWLLGRADDDCQPIFAPFAHSKQ